MNKGDLISALAEKTETSKREAEAFVEAFVNTVTETLQGKGDVALTGFGTFSAKDRAARQGVNPRTGEKIQIAATTVPKFKAGKTLKEALKK